MDAAQLSVFIYINIESVDIFLIFFFLNTWLTLGQEFAVLKNEKEKWNCSFIFWHI